MNNFVKSGDNLTLAGPYDVLSGGGFKVGNVFGVAANDTLAGANVSPPPHASAARSNATPAIGLRRLVLISIAQLPS